MASGRRRAARGDRSTRSSRSARATSACSCTGTPSCAPTTRSASPPSLDETDPSSAGYDWSRYDRVLAEARARGIDVLVTRHRPGAALGDAGKRRPHLQAEPRPASALRRGGRQALRRAVSTRGRSGTSPTTRSSSTPQSVKRQAVLAASSTARSTRRALQGLGAPGNGGDRVLIGETAPRGTPRVVAPADLPARDACLDAATQARAAQARPTATPTTPTRRKAGPFFVPPDRDDVTIGVAAPPHARARPRRRASTARAAAST